MLLEELFKRMIKYLSADDIKLVEAAYQYALKAHGEQVRISGEPYITHPLAVAHILCHLELDAASLAAALLHDVVEDTSTSLEEIKNLGASDEIIKAIDLLTHKKESNYYDYIRNVSKNNLAIAVKLADLADNTDPIRMGKLPYDLRERLLKKYEKALSLLNEGK